MNRRIGIVVSIAAMCSGLLAGFGAGPAQAVTPTVTRDPCLRGQWQMPAAESTRLLSQIAGLPGWAVTRGTITMSFNRGIQRYGSTLFIIEGDLGAQSFTMEASWINEAPYRTRAGKIVTRRGTSEINFGEMTGTKDGQTYSVPGPPGRTSTTPAGATPYRCTRTTLTWPVPLGGGTTQAKFRRA